MLIEITTCLDVAFAPLRAADGCLTCPPVGVFIDESNTSEGAGNQARAHLVALSKLYRFRKVKVYTRSPENREALARDMTERFDLPVEPVDEPRMAATDVDIILAATNASVAVLDGNWLEEGVHITSIVSSNIGLIKRGLPATAGTELASALDTKIIFSYR